MRGSKRIFTLLVLVFTSAQVLALPVPPPDLRCVSVETTGDITLTWLLPNDPNGDFLSYQIYGSSTGAAGPYTLLGTELNYTTTTFLHAGANGHTSSWHYYVVTEHNNPAPVLSATTDTLTNMILNINNPGTGIVTLTWNPVISPPLPSFQPPYNIYRQINTGAFTLYATTTQLSYTDTITTCNDIVSYRIEAVDGSGCSSFSSINGGQFPDLIGPGFTTIDSVSIDCVTGDIVMGWKPNPAPDVYYYIFYTYDDTQSPPWVKTDSVAGSQHFASVPSGTDCGGTYSIAAFDTCGLAGLISDGHQAMCLTYDYESCQRKVDLTWNNYRGWAGGVNQYLVFASQDGGPYELVQTNLGNDTVASIEALSPQSTYCFYVRAVANGTGFTSSSNCICFFSLGIELPAFHYLEYVTVLPNGSVELEARVDRTAKVKNYIIERADTENNVFVPLDSIERATLTDPFINWTDDSVNTDQLSYTYRVIAADSCGMGVDTTNYGKTILLTGEKGPGYWESHLKWTEYIYWPSGVSYYNAYRVLNYVVDSVPFATVDPFDFQAIDDVEQFPNADGEVCYYVEAIESPGDGIPSSSRSNITCVQRDPLMFIPNAFTPGGLNPVFKPEFAFIDHHAYTLTIFDRWGQRIFETDDVDLGWDGNLRNGSKAPTGIYVYMVQWSAATGEKFQRHGHLSLLRHK